LFYAEHIFAGECLSSLATFLGLTLPSGEKIRAVLSDNYNRQKEGEFPKPEDWPKDMVDTANNIIGDELDHYPLYWAINDR